MIKEISEGAKMGIQPSNGSKKEQKLGLNNEVISRGQIFNN